MNSTPNTALHRTPAAAPLSPVSFQTLGLAIRHSSVSARGTTVALIIAMAAQAIAQDPPRGFVWEEVRPLKARVLRLVGWNHAIHDVVDGRGYMSYVNDDLGVPLASFGLYERRPISRKVPPERVVSDLMAESTQKFEAKGPIRRFNDGPFTGASGFFSRGVQPEEGTTHNLYVKVVVSKATRTGYLFIFETPEKAWVKQWKIGQIVVNSVRLTPTL
jgi:hypothetical protein